MDYYSVILTDSLDEPLILKHTKRLQIDIFLGRYKEVLARRVPLKEATKVASAWRWAAGVALGKGFHDRQENVVLTANGIERPHRGSEGEYDQI